MTGGLCCSYLGDEERAGESIRSWVTSSAGLHGMLYWLKVPSYCKLFVPMWPFGLCGPRILQHHQLRLRFGSAVPRAFAWPEAVYSAKLAFAFWCKSSYSDLPPRPKSGGSALFLVEHRTISLFYHQRIHQLSPVHAEHQCMKTFLHESAGSRRQRVHQTWHNHSNGNCYISFPKGPRTKIGRF